MLPHLILQKFPLCFATLFAAMAAGHACQWIMYTLQSMSFQWAIGLVLVLVTHAVIDDPRTCTLAGGCPVDSEAAVQTLGNDYIY